MFFETFLHKTLTLILLHIPINACRCGEDIRHTITVQFAVSSDSFDDATECVDIKQNTLPAWPITFIKI